MAKLPLPIEQQDELDCRLGIKSSLSEIASIVGLSYALYCANGKQSEIIYADEVSSDGKKKLSLKRDYIDWISANFSTDEYILNANPLLTSQLESLQVGLGLMFRLAKISYVDYPNTDTKERTGGERYRKLLRFATNMKLLDVYLSAWSESNVKQEISSWIKNSPTDSEISKGIKQILTTFSEDTQFKIRSNQQEVVFQQDGIYRNVSETVSVVAKDEQEDVGPFRVLKSFVKEGLHPYLTLSHNEFYCTDTESLKNYRQMVETGLQLSPKKIYVYSDSPKYSHSQRIVSKEINKSFLPYLTAIRTKPFLLLAGISGTGKSRIVRKLAQATTTKELQIWNDGMNFDEERWNIHAPENFQLIQVKPNWHNSMDVAGYLSNIPSPHYVFTPFVNFIVKAWRNPGVPFFLCLDEMNLAPVEEYFAEFLSAIESRSKKNGKYKTDPIIKPFNEFGKEVAEKMIDDLFPDIKAHEADERLAKLTRLFKEHGLTLPENLIVIGTVNMDETTFSFSRKVLDRAMSIEMNDVNYDDFLNSTTDDGLKALVEAFAKGEGASLNELLTHRHIEAKEVVEELGGDDEGSDAKFVINYLKQINKLLEGTPFKLGYRAANEALIYLDSTRAFGNSDRNAALDNFTLMKILSRIEGDESKLKITSSESDRQRLLDCGISADEASRYGDLTILTAMREIVKRDLGESAKSIAKIDQMISMLARDHFVSYWN